MGVKVDGSADKASAGETTPEHAARVVAGIVNTEKKKLNDAEKLVTGNAGGEKNAGKSTTGTDVVGGEPKTGASGGAQKTDSDTQEVTNQATKTCTCGPLSF